MKPTPLKPLDNSWLHVESPDTPMHVPGLMIFELPVDAAPDFFQKLLEDAREHQVFYPPWNRRLDGPHLKRLWHSWVEVETVDIDYHVRLSALPWPGGSANWVDL